MIDRSGKLAEKFGCGKTQVSDILKQKTLVREECERGFSSAKKRNRTSQYSDVNDATKKCLHLSDTGLSRLKR